MRNLVANIVNVCVWGLLNFYWMGVTAKYAGDRTNPAAKAISMKKDDVDKKVEEVVE